MKKLLKDDNLFLRDARIACIDGYVESVSELHLLLEELSEAKVPCFLFVRGMSEDVLHTIKTNNDRKTLMVFPYIVPFDLDSVNTIVDIAVSAGTDVLSNLKSDKIQISLGDANSSAVITLPGSESFKYVVMPMRI